MFKPIRDRFEREPGPFAGTGLPLAMPATEQENSRETVGCCLRSTCRLGPPPVTVRMTAHPADSKEQNAPLGPATPIELDKNRLQGFRLLLAESPLPRSTCRMGPARRATTERSCYSVAAREPIWW